MSAYIGSSKNLKDLKDNHLLPLRLLIRSDLQIRLQIRLLHLKDCRSLDVCGACKERVQGQFSTARITATYEDSRVT